MTDTLELVRGAHYTINITDLLAPDVNGVLVPAEFVTGDVLNWTAKAHWGDPAALLSLSSDDSQITFVDGEDHAQIEILHSDWSATPWLRDDLPFVWQLDYIPGGNLELTTPLRRSEDAVIHPDGAAGPSDIGGQRAGGPCEAWITITGLLADDRCKRPDGGTFDSTLLTEVIDVASEILFRATGRQFPGLCSDEVFPVVQPVNPAVGLGPILSGSGTRVPPWPPYSPISYNPLDSLSKIDLGVYPIRQISEVKIDGVVLDPAEYMILDRRWLARVDGLWPVGSDLLGDPDDTEQRTFRVQLTWGRRPPATGVFACKTYAIELAKGACGDPCALPERVQSITSQGISFGLLDPMQFLQDGLTGIYTVDEFIKQFNPAGLRRQSSVINPDIPQPVVRRS